MRDLPDNTYYIIREKKSGRVMPTIPDRYRGGYTHTEPQHLFCCTPRLFSTAAGASRALGAWVRGRWKKVTGTDDDAFGNQITVITGSEAHKVEGRRKEDFEIVPIRLRVRNV